MPIAVVGAHGTQDPLQNTDRQNSTFSLFRLSLQRCRRMQRHQHNRTPTSHTIFSFLQLPHAGIYQLTEFHHDLSIAHAFNHASMAALSRMYDALAQESRGFSLA